MYTPKYFSPTEFSRLGCSIADMREELLYKLDCLREQLHHPITITSAYRTKEHELSKGRSGKSAHTRGYAVDIAIPDNEYRFNVLKYAIPLFSRIGVGSNFIHLDCDVSLPYPRVWTY